MSDEAPKVVVSLEDETGEYCVDILEHSDGQFTFAEYVADEDGWHLTDAPESDAYATQYAAYLGAVKAVSWLIA